jgi:hypothetical protein
MGSGVRVYVRPVGLVQVQPDRAIHRCEFSATELVLAQRS